MLKPLVFVIEKEQALSKLFCNWLKEWSYETIEFSSVNNSLPYWERLPNAIIVDLKTVNNEKNILIDQYNKFKTPIICVAHYTDYDIVERNNFFDICPFPVEPKHLKQIVKNATKYHVLLLENKSLQPSNNKECTTNNYFTRDEDMINLVKRVKERLNEGCYVIMGERAVGKTTFIKKIILPGLKKVYKIHTVYSENMNDINRNIINKIDMKSISSKNILEIRIPTLKDQDYDIYKIEELGIKKENIFIIPPLRKRPNDLLYFVSSLITTYNKSTNKNIKGISPETEQKLLQYMWPDNFEELKVTIEKAFILENSELIQPDHIIFNYPQLFEDSNTAKREELVINKLVPLELIKKKIILYAYEKCNGNIFMAARRLNIGRATMYRLLHKYNII